ncbi:MAG TPA: hypothetical protein DCZ88_08075 [Pseudanabaena sp.]|nr:hypothetical protein [Pseudanabaena sp.]
MIKLTAPKMRRYRVKRKAVKPRKRFSVFNAVVMVIAFLCIALAIPLLLIASPFVLCAVGLLLVANGLNEVRDD